VPSRWLLVRDPRHRFEPQALLCTEPDRTSEQILRWFIQRWQLEVTFQEIWAASDICWASAHAGAARR
jgi:hypothetical protein